MYMILEIRNTLFTLYNEIKNLYYIQIYLLIQDLYF